MQTFIPNCQFKYVFPAYIGIDISLLNFHMVFRKFNKHVFQFP
jgi:uncharacterized membrane protein